MRVANSYLFTFLIVLAVRAEAFPPYEKGCLTPQNAAYYLTEVKALAAPPAGFSGELMRLVLALYPPLSQDELQLEDLAALAPLHATERAGLLSWLVANFGTRDRYELVEKALKFDPDKRVRAEAAAKLIQFRTLPPSLFELALTRMQEDLDAEVRLALMQSLSVMRVDMTEPQSVAYVQALQNVSAHDIAPHIVDEANCSLVVCRQAN